MNVWVCMSPQNNLCTVIQEECCMYAHDTGAKLVNGMYLLGLRSGSSVSMSNVMLRNI